MAKQFCEPKHHQIESGDWVPQVHVYQLVPGGMDCRPLYNFSKRFDSEADARNYSIAMAFQWLRDNGLPEELSLLS